MNNTVLVERKIRRQLRLTCTILCIFCITFIAFLICITSIRKQNLNSQVSYVNATLDKVYETNSNTVTMQDGKEYNVVWSKDIELDLNDYKGREVTLVTTQKTFGASNPWVLGLVVDGETLVNYHDTLSYKIKENIEMQTVLIVVTCVVCVATCGVFIWRFNIKPTVERPLYHEFAEFLTPRQPTCPQRKIILYYTIANLVLVLALVIAAISIDPSSDSITDIPAAAQAVLWTLLTVVVGGTVGLIVLTRWINRCEIDFYANNLPFDFSDISHAPLRKKIKAELQEQILKDRLENPDTYADGGNGYDVVFDENGVTLKAPFEEENSLISRNAMPDANEVFGSDIAPINDASVNEPQKNTAKSSGITVMKLSYDKLNFEAVAHYRKRVRPMMIIVKSRLVRQNDFPEELVNDIHIALDVNLLGTLQKYNVKVENLDYLLENKKQLMTENCLTCGKNRNKMTK